MPSDKFRADRAKRTRTLTLGAVMLVAGAVLAGFGWSTPSLVLAGKAVLFLVGLTLVFQASPGWSSASAASGSTCSSRSP